MDRSNLPWVSVDLDSTTCDTSHRHATLGGLAKKNPEDWITYSMACADDTPIMGTVALLNALYPTHRLIFISGRNAEATDLTMEWFRKHDIPFDGLYLKPIGFEWESQENYKYNVIKAFEDAFGLPVSFHIDDWEIVKTYLEDRGIPTVHVVPPGFQLVSPSASSPDNPN